MAVSQGTHIPYPFSLMEFIIRFPVLNLLARIQKLCPTYLPSHLQPTRDFFSNSLSNSAASHGVEDVRKKKTTHLKEADGSAQIRREEVEMVMEKLLGMAGGDQSVEDLSSLFEEEEPTMEELEEAFSVFDKNCDGFIDAQELQVVLSTLGYRDETLSLEKCREMIAAYDDDTDGRIDFHEFVNFMEECFNRFTS